MPVDVQAVAVPFLAELEEHRSDQRFVDPVLGVDARLGQKVAGNLLAHELVERNVRLNARIR